MDNSKLGNYLLYLNVIQGKINKFFEDQKEYICCHEGCSKCCRHAQFPFTEIEFRLLLQGMFSLEQSLQFEIMDKIESIIQKKAEHNKTTPNERFRYDCPFLVDNKCSVYTYRGIICRCFGLMAFQPDSDRKSQVPFCAYEGLNYSNVFDASSNTISKEKFEKLNLKAEPKAFNAGYLSLIDDEFGKGFDFEFGEVKPMIDWFEIFGKTQEK